MTWRKMHTWRMSALQHEGYVPEWDLGDRLTKSLRLSGLSGDAMCECENSVHFDMGTGCHRYGAADAADFVATAYGRFAVCIACALDCHPVA